MLDFLQTAAFYVVPFLLVLGLVVTVHELGHFWAARALGISVDRFSLGFGKAIAQWKDKAGVEWRIGWLPLGGYVKFSGDENEASVPDQDHLEALRRELIARGDEQALNGYFQFRPVWQRAVVTAAGPISNFILAIAIFAAIAGFVGEPYTPARVGSVLPASAAAEAGFQPGDLVLEVDGGRIERFQELEVAIKLRSDTRTSFLIERDGRQLLIQATPRRQDIVNILGRTDRLGVLGIRSDPSVELRRYGPIEALGRGVAQTSATIKTTLFYLGRLFTGREGPEQLSGPLGMAHLSGDLAKLTRQQAPDTETFIANLGLRMINLAAVISVGIGFINLLPIPVLDGGHLLFYAYEALARRPLAAKVQAVGYRAGLALVLGLMLFATWNDLQRLRVFSILGGLGT
ncbi:RIP metalloprotease [Phenylobacterium sp.]|jgi:regulator of sigma E protease|uniref:M50 family metallopeptidase n=1 Tax=Phenylobacterium sp. TaxID=1871053 RepID=UPI002E317643|nr:RIP metalloprotease [Phenylobacterium sp.]HEX2558616.1 RIP metalloprotease [Phenylobacterium sp.]